MIALGWAGQTMDFVGVFLETPCFSHGQLYVAMSRVGSPHRVRFALPLDDSNNFTTKNVVYHEALNRPDAVLEAFASLQLT